MLQTSTRAAGGSTKCNSRRDRRRDRVYSGPAVWLRLSACLAVAAKRVLGLRGDRFERVPVAAHSITPPAGQKRNLENDQVREEGLSVHIEPQPVRAHRGSYLAFHQ